MKIQLDTTKKIITLTENVNLGDLADKLNSIKGLAMVSSYDCDLYNELYKSWRKVKFPVKKNNIRSGSVQEVIWMNYERSNGGLFESI